MRESPDGFFCPVDRLTFERRGGIWRFLTPETAARTAAFVRDYETVRRAEGRGFEDSESYRRLPDTDPADPHAAMWRIRAASYRCLDRSVLHGLPPGPLRAADLGAGSGWLANRLASRGHGGAGGAAVDAVDLLDNDWDGLGAHRHFDAAFRPVQASFDALPYRPALFDLIVFNASFHYSVDYSATLEHVLGFLRQSGRLVIVDTPVYNLDESGRAMVAEREREFTRRFRFPSNALPLENYLTHDRLGRLAAEFGLELRLHRPRHGFRRQIAPVLARLRRRREPAAFPVIVLKERAR